MALSFWGTGAEGQSPLLNSWVGKYVEETAVALDLPPRRASHLQQADINSVLAGTGGDASSLTPAPSLEASTLHDSAILAITPPDGGYLDRLMGHRSQVIEYTVQEGDLLSFIASDFAVSIDSIVWANSLKDVDSISPGQILRIPPVSGVIHKVLKGETAQSLAKKYQSDGERIIAYNRLPKDGLLVAGEEVIVPGGIMPNRAPILTTSTVARTTGTSALSAAAKQFSHLPDLGEYFKLPTSGFNWGRIHGRNGVDIANSCGTNIYAAADGKVTVSDPDGYNGGFGKYIKIVHGNSTETLYAHTSKILVDAGQVVAKGDKIALMGTTGRSTGCHLHFEVHGAQNPLAKK